MIEVAASLFRDTAGEPKRIKLEGVIYNMKQRATAAYAGGEYQHSPFICPFNVNHKTYQ